MIKKLYTYQETFWGRVLLLSDVDYLTGLYLVGQTHIPSLDDTWHYIKDLEIFTAVATQLKDYVDGHRKTFDIPYRLNDTVFRKKVWSVVAEIPYGETRSYKEIANTISCLSNRAVAGAIVHNPLLLIIPCHRVIGTDGSLTGYVGGLHLKNNLLMRERNEKA